MAEENQILRRIKEEVGLKMDKSVDFEILSQAIKDKTNERLGINTLKRLFGYKNDIVVPRVSTMEIIAHYLGYKSYEELIKDFGLEADISIFSSVDCIEVQDLETGAQVRITYSPRREIFLTYLGGFRFIVNKVKGSRNIQKDDILTITQLAVGHRFLATHVVRDGEDLGGYESAKYKGLESVETVSLEPDDAS